MQDSLATETAARPRKQLLIQQFNISSSTFSATTTIFTPISSGSLSSEVCHH
jgi:hypothetical protein